MKAFILLPSTRVASLYSVKSVIQVAWEIMVDFNAHLTAKLNIIF